MTDPVVQRLTDDRAALLVMQPFLALLVMQLEIVADETVPTARTNGRELLVNPEFIAQLDALERRYLLGHLVWHCALLHPWRRAHRDRARWDLAIDHEANAILHTSLPLPSQATFFEEHETVGAEGVYDWLGTLDSLPERSPMADHHTSSEAMETDRHLERQWAEHLLTAAQQVLRRGLRLPPAIQRVVEGLRAPRLPWQEALRRFVTPVLAERRRWLPPNRRHLSRGLYLPSRREPLLRVVVGLDTSASTHRLQGALLGELMGIVGAIARYELVLLQADHELRVVSTYSSNEPLDPEQLEPLGGGGTDLRLFFDAIEQRYWEPAVLIVLTDGLGPAPLTAPSYPVIWALPQSNRPPVNWGEALYFCE